jgi:methylmalonyl-CoA/ethylmalonyl-CoA epimerase
MTILGVQHIGVVVEDYARASERFEKVFGLKVRDFRDDQGRGMQYDGRILLGNDCWLHIVENWNPESRVHRFLREHGEGLEHIALRTDDIEADVQRLRRVGVAVYKDTIFDAQDGYEAFVYPDQTPGVTVELIQPHESSWGYPQDLDEPVSTKMGITRLQHIGLAVENLKEACQRLEQLFGLACQDFRDDQGGGMQYDARILLRNKCWLHLVQNWNPESRVYRFREEHGEGLEHIALKTESIHEDVDYLREIGVPVFRDKVLDAQDGFEAFVYPDQTPGVTVELIQPHETSWTYPE